MSLARLAAQDRTAVPWKDGGGVTFPVAVFPAHAGFEDFAWRVSIAEVAKPGPFSRFPGIDRILTVLSGTMRLAGEEGDPVWLSAKSHPFAFSGDGAMTADQVAEPVVDLNVMTRRGVCQASVRRIADLATAPPVAFDQWGLVIALSPSRLIVEGCDHALDHLDAVLFEGPAAPLSGAGNIVVVEIVSCDGSSAPPS
jgi:environmental stress-induced protein Ves